MQKIVFQIDYTKKKSLFKSNFFSTVQREFIIIQLNLGERKLLFF